MHTTILFLHRNSQRTVTTFLKKMIVRLNPSFFKIMIGDFKQRLRVPPAFIQQLKGNLHGKYILKGSSGKKWNVHLGKVHNNLYFRSGWPCFVEDHCLEIGDFLLFSYDGNSGFDVKVFGKSGCEKEEASTGRNTSKPNSWKMEQKFWSRAKIEGKRILEAEGSFKPRHPYFFACCTGSCLNKVMIPKALTAKYGIGRKEQMILHDPLGRSWTVKLGKLRRDRRIELSKGWPDFLIGNVVEIGDVCAFEFIEGGNELLVHIIRANQEIEAVARKHGTCLSKKRMRSKEPINSIKKLKTGNHNKSHGQESPDQQQSEGFVSNPDQQQYVDDHQCSFEINLDDLIEEKSSDDGHIHDIHVEIETKSDLLSTCEDP